MAFQIDEHPTVPDFRRKAATMPTAALNPAPLDTGWLRRANTRGGLGFDAVRRLTRKRRAVPTDGELLEEVNYGCPCDICAQCAFELCE